MITNLQIPLSKISEKIWCGTVISFNHNIQKHNIEFLIKVLDSGISKVYQLTLLEVFELKLSYTKPEEEWDYIEITEVNIKQLDKAIQIKFDLWSSGNILIICRKVDLEEIDN